MLVLFCLMRTFTYFSPFIKYTVGLYLFLVVIKFVNDLLSKCNVDFVVEDIEECNSNLFLAMFHAILGDYPPGKL